MDICMDRDMVIIDIYIFGYRYIYMDIDRCIYGYMDILFYGYIDIWIHGCMDIWIRYDMIYEYIWIWIYMDMTDDNLGLRVAGLRLHHLQSQEPRPLLGAQPAALLEGQEEIIMSTVIVVLFIILIIFN